MKLISTTINEHIAYFKYEDEENEADLYVKPEHFPQFQKIVSDIVNETINSKLISIGAKPIVSCKRTLQISN